MYIMYAEYVYVLFMYIFLYACVHTYFLLMFFSSAILQHRNSPVSCLITSAQYGFTKSLQRRMLKAHSS